MIFLEGRLPVVVPEELLPDVEFAAVLFSMVIPFCFTTVLELELLVVPLLLVVVL